MDNNKRREKILEVLSQSGAPVSASVFAEQFGVTRQIIVSDIAILRAMGHKIISEKRGYYTEKTDSNMLIETITCRHTEKETSDEFYAVVDNGGKVLDVIIEHPIYGQISANLNIASRFDADEFVQTSKKYSAIQLCNLTHGLHLHTIAIPDREAYERTIKRLSELGILQDI